MYFFRLQQNLSSPDNKFLLHTVEAIGKLKQVKKLFREYVHVQLMRYYYMNVEIIRKCGNVNKSSIWRKKYTIPADKFLLHPRSRKFKKN